ncbi:hypothetical protein [Streptomyces sp. NPDC001135]
MGLFHRRRDTDTRYPGKEVVARSAEELWAGLLGLNQPGAPYVVRPGTAEDGADLVAEYRVMEPAWRTFFARSQLDRLYRIRMRLVPAAHEVHVSEEQREVTWVGDALSVPASASWRRGPVQKVSRQWTIGRGAKGGFEMTETFRFDSSEMRNPVQSTVLGAGWTWRGVHTRHL